MADEGTEERLQYAATPDSGPGEVTITASTSDDEGIGTRDQDSVDVEIPYEGVLYIEADSDDVELVPNFTDGNPRDTRTRGDSDGE